MKLRALSGKHDLAQFEEVLNLAFSVPAGASFLDDFPVWSAKRDGTLLLGIEHQNKLVSVGGLCSRELWIDSQLAPVGLLGAIATRPEYRKQGLAETIVRALVAEADRRSLQATFLWGSDHAYYGKFGFVAFGKQCRFRASDLMLASSATRPDSLSDDLRFGLTDAIINHLCARNTGLRLTESDRWLSNHKNTRWISLESSEGQLQAFVAVDRGIDLPNIVHEWGGSMPGILKIISTLLAGRPDLEVICPSAVLGQWPISKAHVVVETLALTRGLNAISPKWKEDSIWFWGLDSA